MSNLRCTVLSRGAKRTSSSNSNDCTPVKWSKYFEKQQYLHINDDVFNIYTSGTSGPILLLIHGGGYSSLTWCLFAEEVTRKIECQLVAIDLRGHGGTKTTDDGNLALDVLAQDIADIVDKMYGENPPPIVIVGHSLGGSVAVEAAACIKNVIGLTVIDVVEGTAIESLSSMQGILRGRPSGFKSIEHAIQWSYRSGQTLNLDAARVSMPGQIKSLLTGCLAANEHETASANGNSSKDKKPHFTNTIFQSSTIVEEKEEQDSSIDLPPTCDILKEETPDSLAHSSSEPHFKVPTEEHHTYTWRIDLTKTEPFWTGWFKGLSQKFLDLPIPKVLILANIHGLDTTLTVGQMQGKFQFQVLPRSGHAIHEDQPHRVADIIAGYLVKQKFAVAKRGFTPLMPAC